MDHAEQLAAERAKCAALQRKLDTVRAMRDVLLEKHQETETKLTGEATALLTAVDGLSQDVAEQRMHIDHRAKACLIGLDLQQNTA